MKRRLAPYLYLSPGLLALFAVTLVPVVASIYFAFTNFSTKHLFNYSFVGLDNFRRILFGID